MDGWTHETTINKLEAEVKALKLQNQELQKTLEHIKDSAMDDTRSKGEIYGIASAALAINKYALKRNCEMCCKHPGEHLPCCLHG